MMNYLAVIGLLVLLLCSAVVIAEDEGNEYNAEDEGDQAEDEGDQYSGGCDSSSISSDVAVRSLTPNTFHKICPKQMGKNFGQPQCGDGSSFAFFFSRPPQKKANDQKILIEFIGGGACWDGDTCEDMEDRLTFPEDFDSFVGLSCSEIQQGVQNGNNNRNNDNPIDMLCAKSVGGVDLTSYNTIIVPYCTQDVHMGDSIITYDDGTTVNHVGAHNMMAVLRWVFTNFKSPSHIALTGCSAGGTALPIAYDLINKQYNKFGVRSVQINTVLDSPVYLTPSYFLNYKIDNWNPWPILKRINFNYDKWRTSEEYPTQLMLHILRRGNRRDRWGFVSHTDDPTSQTYYEYMSGLYDENYGGNNNRDLEGDDAYQQQWYSELSASVSKVEKKHKNVESFWIEDEGHCSFGLYYALQVDGFESWVGSILAEKKIAGHTVTSVPLFATAVVLGVALSVGIMFYSGKQRQIEMEGGDFLSYTTPDTTKTWRAKFVGFLAGLQSYKATAGYIFAVTIYFWSMIIARGFAHPLNNPSLGPSAIALSGFGINNPSLIVYKGQIFRLITSSMLCSGALTWLIVVICSWFFVRPLEQKFHKHFLTVCGLMIVGTNLVYALIAQGASCSSTALVFGLAAFSFMVQRAVKESRTILLYVNGLLLVITAVIFSLNNWFMQLSAVALGVILFLVLFDVTEGAHSENQSYDGFSQFRKAEPEFMLKQTRLYSVLGVYGMMFILLLFRVRRPNELYLQPFYTGCNLKYSDSVDAIAEMYFDNDSGVRKLSGSNDGSGDEQDTGTCAQFCIPHLASKVAGIGANRILGLPLSSGSCQDNGYEEHIADKTFNYFTYSLDVEVYTESGYDDDYAE